MATEMESLLESLRAGKAAGPVSPDTLKAEWQDAIVDLFDQIRKWLQPAVDEGLVDISEKEIALYEEPMGEYRTKAMYVSGPAGRVVTIVPHVRQVFGGLGRVDIHAGATKTLVLRKQPADPDAGVHGEWSILLSRVPHRKEEKLTEDSFARLLRSVLA
jgi:hypothetical protein